MKTKLYSGIIGSLILIGGCSAEADEKLETNKDKASYTIGIQLGSQMAQNKDDIDLDKVMMGLKEAFAGSSPRSLKSSFFQVCTNR